MKKKKLPYREGPQTTCFLMLIDGLSYRTHENQAQAEADASLMAAAVQAAQVWYIETRELRSDP